MLKNYPSLKNKVIDIETKIITTAWLTKKTVLNFKDTEYFVAIAKN